MGEGNFSCGIFIQLGSPGQIAQPVENNFKSTFCLVKKEVTSDLFFTRIGKTMKKLQCQILL